MLHQNETQISIKKLSVAKRESFFLKTIRLLEGNDTWSVDRFGRFFAGSLGLSFSLLGYLHSPLWLLIIIPMYFSQIITSFSNNCKFEALFLSLGLKQREELYNDDGTLKIKLGGK